MIVVLVRPLISRASVTAAMGRPSGGNVGEADHEHRDKGESAESCEVVLIHGWGLLEEYSTRMSTGSEWLVGKCTLHAPREEGFISRSEMSTQLHAPREEGFISRSEMSTQPHVRRAITWRRAGRTA